MFQISDPTEHPTKPVYPKSLLFISELITTTREATTMSSPQFLCVSESLMK